MSYSHLLILLTILVSSLIKICHLHNTSPLFLNHTSAIFVILDVFVILLIKLLPAPLLRNSLIYSKIDYCSSLLLNLPATQMNCLQLVLNSAARAVTKTHKFHHITPFLHWLKINERIKYKVLSLTYISLKTGLTSALFFHSLHIVVLGLLLSPLVTLLSPLVLK